MRNVEFLPSWYPALGRRKLALKIQTWLALSAIALLSSIAAGQSWQVRRQQDAVSRISNQVALSSRQAARLRDLQNQRQMLLSKQQQIARLGLRMPTTALLNQLEDALPAKTSLIGLTVEPGDPTGTRIRIQGVSPTDEQVAQTLTNLKAAPCFQNVDMTYVRDRVQQGRLMREFEITFAEKAGGS